MFPGGSAVQVTCSKFRRTTSVDSILNSVCVSLRMITCVTPQTGLIPTTRQIFAYSGIAERDRIKSSIRTVICFDLRRPRLNMLTPSDCPADYGQEEYVDSASHCDDVWIRNGVVAWIEIFRVSLIDSVQRGYLFYSLNLCPRAK